MKDLSAMTRQLKDLASQVHANQILSTDEGDAPVWIDGCGLHVAFQVMKLGRDLGRETTLADFPEDLLEQIRLWSRAELQDDRDGQIGKITKELCQQILDEGHR